MTAVDNSFDSGILGPSEGFSWYFEAPGTYEYLCTLHPWMVAQVVVPGEVAPPEQPPDMPEEPTAE